MTTRQPIDLDAIAAATDALVAHGLREDAAIEAIADALDGLVDWRKVLPGEAGRIAEASDDELFERAVRWLRDLLRVDPVKRSKRRAKHERKVAARKARRAARREEVDCRP